MPARAGATRRPVDARAVERRGVPGAPRAAARRGRGRRPRSPRRWRSWTWCRGSGGPRSSAGCATGSSATSRGSSARCWRARVVDRSSACEHGKRAPPERSHPCAGGAAPRQPRAAAGRAGGARGLPPLPPARAGGPASRACARSGPTVTWSSGTARSSTSAGSARTTRCGAPAGWALRRASGLGPRRSSPAPPRRRRRTSRCGGTERALSLSRSRCASRGARPETTAGVVLLVEDLTERKLLAAQVAHQDRLASVGRLAAGVAHEIGNPLTGIACLAQNLARELADGGPARAGGADPEGDAAHRRHRAGAARLQPRRGRRAASTATRWTCTRAWAEAVSSCGCRARRRACHARTGCRTGSTSRGTGSGSSRSS